jgi:hypothetical protein
MTLLHSGADFLLEFRQPPRLIGRRQLFQVRRSTLSAVLLAKPASSSADAAVSSCFNAAAKSSPPSGMPSAAQ